ncbi:MAG: hypothetical protein IPG51_00750, partial [Chloroflexi bacterium]|nr:hypothetical protein [Chloroflexota bacterium]
MIAIETIALVIAILSLVVSTIYNAYQTRQSSKAYLLNQQIERGNAIIHFNSKFAELTSKINREQQFGDPDWANKFWSLHAMEFYFFHHGIIPESIYALWMMDVARLYSSQNKVQIRDS